MAKIKEPPYTAAEETEFYRRNAGGPVAMSMTRGRGVVSGIVGDLDWHVGSYYAMLLEKEIDAWMDTFDDYNC